MNRLTFFSIVLNIILLAVNGLLFLAAYIISDYVSGNPIVGGLGDNYIVQGFTSEISAPEHEICYDEYRNFDNYFVVKKKYDGNQEIVKKWRSDRDGRIVNEADTVSKIPGQTYYYIIRKDTNRLTGPLTYEDFISRSTHLGLSLF